MALQPKKSETKSSKPAAKTTDDAGELSMGTQAGGTNDVFDVSRVRKLVELMQEFDLSLLDLKQADQRVRLRRGSETVVMAGSSGVNAPQVPVAPPPPPVTSAAPRAAETPAASGKKTAQIKSPMVGTFYPASKPEAPPYVKVGDMVSPETTVCLIEAMKVFNELPAEASGRIVAVLVEAGAPVEYGQALFEIEPA